PLGPYSGNLLVTDPQSFASVDYVFTAISDATGDLQVYATDEFTYWAVELPPVVGAIATLRDVASGAVIATLPTDAKGFALFEDLAEAWYDLEVRADDHGTFRGTVLVPGGQTRMIETFLTRQLVTYQWSVFPTEILDEYLIIIDALFETFVPAPVVTIERSSVDLRLLTGETMQIDFVITNHGLITADDVRLDIGDHPKYAFEPLITVLGDLPAQTSVVVPVVIRDTTFNSSTPPASRGNFCVGVRFVTQYELICGIPRTYSVPVFFRVPDTDCGGAPGSGGFINPPPCTECSPGIATGIPDFSEPIPCSPCSEPDCPLKIFTCFLGFTPAGCPLGLFQNCGGDLSFASLRGCAWAAATGCLAGPFGPAFTLYDCTNDVPDLERLPDRLHTSDFAVLAVSTVLDGLIDGPPVAGDLDVLLTATVPSGWVYLRIDEPSGNLFTILSVTRSDGKPILMGDNAWTTHRIVRPEGEAAFPEDFLHLFDHDSPGSYTIVYEEFPDADSDNIPDAVDNCLNTPNNDQANSDTDEVGDACDNCPQTDNADQADGDGVGNVCDNCVFAANNDQADIDQDDVGDACDNCLATSNNDQADSDGAGVVALCD
ncbi:MAG: thrombospondin type 3 repeat-containing protein, partial [Planctomycetes bacterium]|nr:thrombospondin type 3 repeat-containing protein [Planctomycetota bacterium]